MNAYKADYRLNEKAQQLCEKLCLAAKKSKTRRRWKTDFTYEKYRRCEVVVMTGNVVYWSKALNV